MARTHDFNGNVNNIRYMGVSYNIGSTGLLRNASSVYDDRYKTNCNIMFLLSDMMKVTQNNVRNISHLNAIRDFKFTIRNDASGSNIVQAGETSNPTRFAQLFGSGKALQFTTTQTPTGFLRRIDTGVYKYFDTANAYKWGSDTNFDIGAGTSFAMIDKTIGEEFNNINSAKCFNQQAIINAYLELNPNTERLTHCGTFFNDIWGADLIGQNGTTLFAQYDSTFDYTPLEDVMINTGDFNGTQLKQLAICCINYLLDNYNNESATPNYYTYNPVKAPHFTYNVRVDADNTTAKIDVVKDFSKIHYGTVLELPKTHISGGGFDITLGCKYSFYIHNTRTGNIHTLLETEEDNNTRNLSFRVPLLQLVSNTDEYKQYIKGVSTDVSAWANNVSCKIDYYSRVIPPLGETFESHSIIDTRLGESAIAYGFTIPPSQSNTASNLNVLENTCFNEANPFRAWLNYLLQIPLIQSQTELYEKLQLLAQSQAFVVATEDASVQYVIPTPPTPDEDDEDYNTPSYNPDAEEDPDDPTPIQYIVEYRDRIIPVPQPIPDHNVITENVVALYTIYKDTGENVGRLANFLWGNDFDLSTLKLINSNPIENIISLRRSPFNFINSGTSNVMLGNVNTGVSMNTVNEDYVATVGSFKIEQVYGNFLDFSPFTIIEMYLPFVGYVQLDPIMVMNKTCTLKVYVDALTMVGKYQLKTYNNILVGEWEFQGGEEIPISASNNAQHMAGIIGSLASTVIGVATGNLTGALNGLGNALTSQVHTTTSGKPTANTSLLTSTEAFLKISYPKYQTNIKYAHTIGRMCQKTHILNELSGFTQLSGKIDLSGVNATQEEKNELENILTTGFYI